MHGYKRYVQIEGTEYNNSLQVATLNFSQFQEKDFVLRSSEERILKSFRKVLRIQPSLNYRFYKFTVG